MACCRSNHADQAGIRLVERSDFARLTSALIRVDHAHAYEQVRDAAITTPRSTL